ncbi:LysR substrate-binding domain-containing protein [Kribbella sp. NPDC048915]|uniref:LysR substrate-binding domain-containing protein n=1 Tax=Kribbella sp. NPDC048915 TaxID=3155148 RepID=UPI0033CD8299
MRNLAPSGLHGTTPTPSSRAASVLRDFWLGLDARTRPPTIAAEATAADETLELVTAGVGIALIAEGNTTLYQRPGLVCRPVPDLAPAQLALAWRADDSRDVVHDFIASVEP